MVHLFRIEMEEREKKEANAELKYTAEQVNEKRSNCYYVFGLNSLAVCVVCGFFFHNFSVLFKDTEVNAIICKSKNNEKIMKKHILKPTYNIKHIE